MTKERLGTNDNVSVTVIRNKGGKVERHETLEIKGFLDVRLIRPSGLVKAVYRGPNTIRPGLPEYFESRLFETAVDYALDNLFTDDNIQSGGTQDGKDGIICRDAGGTARTCITTSVAESNTYGAKWKGEIEFTESLEIDEATLYHSFASSGIRWAVQSFTSVFVQSADQMVFNWEVYV